MYRLKRIKYRIERRPLETDAILFTISQYTLTFLQVYTQTPTQYANIQTFTITKRAEDLTKLVSNISSWFLVLLPDWHTQTKSKHVLHHSWVIGVSVPAVTCYSLHIIFKV